MVTMVIENYWFKMISFHSWNFGERCAYFIQKHVEERPFIPMKINKNKKMMARTATYLGV